MKFKSQLLIGIDSELPFYPQRGRPDAAPAPAPTVTVYGAGDDSLTPIDATLDGVAADIGDLDEDITVDAAVGDLSVTVADGSDAILGDRVWLTNELNQGEEMVVSGFGATSITFPDILANSYTAAGTPTPTIQSHRLSIDVGAALLTEIVRDARAIWVYYKSGRRYAEPTYYDVVLQRSDWEVTAADLRQAWVDFPEAAGGGQVNWDRAIEGSRLWLQKDLEASGWYSDLLRNPSLAQQFIVAKTIERFYASQTSMDIDQLNYWRSQSREAFKSIQTYYQNSVRADDPIEVAFGFA